MMANRGLGNATMVTFDTRIPFEPPSRHLGLLCSDDMDSFNSVVRLLDFSIVGQESSNVKKPSSFNCGEVG